MVPGMLGVVVHVTFGVYNQLIWKRDKEIQQLKADLKTKIQKKKVYILFKIQEEYDKLLYDEKEAIKHVKEEVIGATKKMLSEMDSKK